MGIFVSFTVLVSIFSQIKRYARDNPEHLKNIPALNYNESCNNMRIHILNGKINH